MEYLEGWELVLDQDDHDDDDSISGREKIIRSTNCLSSSSSSSLEELDTATEKEKEEAEDEEEEEEDVYQYPGFVDRESAKALKDEEDEETKDEQSQRGGFDIWKWRLTGIGALCSFGVATACVLVLGEAPKKNSHSHSHRCYNLKGYEQNQRLVAAVRGGSVHVPLTTAHITFGGYVYAAAHLST